MLYEYSVIYLQFIKQVVQKYIYKLQRLESENENEKEKEKKAINSQEILYVYRLWY